MDLASKVGRKDSAVVLSFLVPAVPLLYLPPAHDSHDISVETGNTCTVFAIPVASDVEIS